MAGLLDFLQQPEGVGLLSAIAGGMTGARRGQPINSVGRGLATGLAGYQGAQDQIRQDGENSLNKQYRSLQMQKIQDEIARSKAEREWRAGLPGKMDAAQTKVTPFNADNPFGEDLGQLANVQQGDPQALQQYIMQPDSPYAEKMMERQLFPKDDDYKVVGDSLVQIGGNGVKPVYTAPPKETYKERTVSPDGQTYIKQYSQDGGKTWQQIEGTRPYDIRASSGSSDITVNGFPKETFKNERDLRNDFQGLPTTKAYREVQTSYDQIRYALKNPSAANDLTAATKFMKLLDPGSVVRESELGMAMAATGQFDRMSNYYNMLKTGQKLTPSQRADFYKSANGLYGAATDRYNQSAQEYRQMSQEYGLNPDRIAKPAAIEKPDNKPKPASKLSPSEQQELQQLRARFKK